MNDHNNCKVCGNKLESSSTNGDNWVTTVYPCGCKYNLQTKEVLYKNKKDEQTPQWEMINNSINLETYRLRVDGGYIYLMIDNQGKTHSTLVPDCYGLQIPSDENKISTRLDKLEKRINTIEEGEWTSKPLNNLITMYSDLNDKIENMPRIVEHDGDHGTTYNINNICVQLDELKTQIKILWEKISNPLLNNFKEYKDSESSCNHDWDYSQVLTSNPPRHRCRKCGKFSDPIDFSKITLGGVNV